MKRSRVERAAHQTVDISFAVPGPKAGQAAIVLHYTSAVSADRAESPRPGVTGVDPIAVGGIVLCTAAMFFFVKKRKV